jgi:histidinol-phosphate/aromatic aminotransferase/cobyric acid decarboxylase-like protein
MLKHASTSDYIDKKGIWYANSYTNFLFFPAKADAAQVLSKLEEKGIGIRVWEYNNHIGSVLVLARGMR